MAFFGRGKNKIQNPYVLKDIYAEYIKDKKENTVYNVTFAVYKSIIVDYIKETLLYIFKGKIFNIPFRLGKVYITKRKISLKDRGLTPNWELTNKLGKIIYHLNEHSGGYRYNFKWDKLNCRDKNHQMYRLVFTRENKRNLAYYIKNDIYDYLEE